jgi:hypothetical protein
VGGGGLASVVERGEDHRESVPRPGERAGSMRGGGVHRGRDPRVCSMRGHGEVEHRRRERRCGEKGGRSAGTFHRRRDLPSAWHRHPRGTGRTVHRSIVDVYTMLLSSSRDFERIKKSVAPGFLRSWIQNRLLLKKGEVWFLLYFKRLDTWIQNPINLIIGLC